MNKKLLLCLLISFISAQGLIARAFAQVEAPKDNPYNITLWAPIPLQRSHHLQ